MSRDEAIRLVRDTLYGLSDDWLEALFEEFGYDALTDEAIIWLAEQQDLHERGRQL